MWVMPYPKAIDEMMTISCLKSSLPLTHPCSDERNVPSLDNKSACIVHLANGWVGYCI